MNALNTATKPLIFKYQQEDYEKWVNDFSRLIETNTVATNIKYPEHFGEEYAKGKIIEPGLSYRIVDYTLNADIEYQSYTSKHFTLSIYFYEINFNDAAYCKIGETIIESNDTFYSAAIMTNSFTEQNLKLKKGTHIKGVSVQIDAEWLQKNISDFSAEKLEMFRQKDCVTDFITAKHRKILLDILNSKPDTALPHLFIKSRVLRLTEQFLTNLCNRNINGLQEFSNPKDFQALMKVEQLLLSTYTPNFPSIESLAKAAYMSESKLKKLFKAAYGMAIYQYYQKNRMHNAKELLCNGKYSISEIGVMLGYKNLSNFSVAFKKEFGYLPSEFQQVL
ncbi:MAG: helix-turn-helix domain-containing protein [Ferruginibacter sp.]